MRDALFFRVFHNIVAMRQNDLVEIPFQNRFQGGPRGDLVFPPKPVLGAGFGLFHMCSTHFHQAFNCQLTSPFDR